MTFEVGKTYYRLLNNNGKPILFTYYCTKITPEYIYFTSSNHHWEPFLHISVNEKNHHLKELTPTVEILYAKK